MNREADWDWDHVRVFLAVTRAKSLRQAGDNLGLSHPTLSRRLEALEAKLGFRLFDRRSDGLHATQEAAELVELAESVEDSMHALARRAHDTNSDLQGRVRVTAPDLIVTDLLMPELSAFSRKYPQIELEVRTSYEVMNLGSREADVAIRIVRHGTLPTDNVAGRKAGTIWSAIYGEGDNWIGWSGERLDRAWIRRTPFPDLPIRGSFNHPALQRAACQAGMGLTKLQCYFADPYLQRRTAPEKAFDIWVVVHPDLQRSPSLRAFRDEMFTAFKRLQPRLEGQY